MASRQLRDRQDPPRRGRHVTWTLDLMHAESRIRHPKFRLFQRQPERTAAFRNQKERRRAQRYDARVHPRHRPFGAAPFAPGTRAIRLVDLRRASFRSSGCRFCVKIRPGRVGEFSDTVGMAKREQRLRQGLAATRDFRAHVCFPQGSMRRQAKLSVRATGHRSGASTRFAVHAYIHGQRGCQTSETA